MAGRWSGIVLLVVAQTIGSSSSMVAQLPPKVEKCLPDPTLAQEIRDMLAEETAPRVTDPKLAEEISGMLDETTPRVTVDAVEFEGKTGLPRSVTRPIAERFVGAGAQFDKDDDYLDFFRELVVSAWQDRGYFYARVSVEKRPSGGDPIDQHVALTARVDKGPRFRVGEFRFVGVHALPDDELREVFSLRRGDLFSRQKTVLGIEALRNLYVARGYMNFVATPDFQVDTAHRRISITINVDEGKQFRVRHLTVIASNHQALESLLRTKLKPGDIYNPERVKAFLRENKSIVPSDASTGDLSVQENSSDGRVDLTLDLWDCPQDQ